MKFSFANFKIIIKNIERATKKIAKEQITIKRNTKNKGKNESTKC